jgi:P27 family predicted phage terminase small subunit
MGQRGPKPKPKGSTLKLTGQRKAAGVPKGVPARPSEVTGEAAREWDRIAADLDAAGVLALVDRGILTAYCLAVADMLAARDAINREGRFLTEPVQTATGAIVGRKTKAHPAVKMLADASGRVQRLAESLGLTPAARQRMGDAGAPAAPAENKVLAIRDRIQAHRSGGTA